MLGQKICIGDKKIGPEEPCFLVAEVGTTCNGQMPLAKELVDCAAEAGFDAVKFQTIWPDQVSNKSEVYRYETVTGWAEENMIEMFKSLVFTRDQWRELAEYARKRGIIFFSTVDYLSGVDLLEELEVPIHKVGSWDVTYEPLTIRLGKTGKPVMLDLGPAGMDEISRFIRVFQESGGKQVILLHGFHTDNPREMNMRNISALAGMMGTVTGFTSPGRRFDLDLLAVAMGASVVEKRISLRRSLQGHHHVLCLEPDEIKPWIDQIRFAERALGAAQVTPSEEDREGAGRFFRSICTTCSVAEGEIFTRENLDGKRPGTGIPTRWMGLFLGRKAKRDLDEDVLLTWEDL